MSTYLVIGGKEEGSGRGPPKHANGHGQPRNYVLKTGQVTRNPPLSAAPSALLRSTHILGTIQACLYLIPPTRHQGRDGLRGILGTLGRMPSDIMCFCKKSTSGGSSGSGVYSANDGSLTRLNTYGELDDTPEFAGSELRLRRYPSRQRRRRPPTLLCLVERQRWRRYGKGESFHRPHLTLLRHGGEGVTSCSSVRFVNPSVPNGSELYPKGNCGREEAEIV